MTLSPDFGIDFVEQGGTVFPESREARQNLVTTFMIASDALTQLGYAPDISSLVSAYQGLSDSLRDRLNRGEIIGKLNPWEAHLVRKYLLSSSDFFGSADIFAIEMVSSSQANERLITDCRTIYEASVSVGVPPSMIVAYAQSLAEYA